MAGKNYFDAKKFVRQHFTKATSLKNRPKTKKTWTKLRPTASESKTHLVENWKLQRVRTNHLRSPKTRRGCFDFRKSADWRGFRLQIYPMLICNSCILNLVLSNTSAATSTIRYYLYLTLSRAFTTILVSLVRFLKGRIEEFTNTEFAFFSVEQCTTGAFYFKKYFGLLTNCL